MTREVLSHTRNNCEDKEKTVLSRGQNNHTHLMIMTKGRRVLG